MLGITIRATYPRGRGLAVGSAAPLRTRRDGQPHRGRDRSLPPVAGRARRLRPSLRQANGAARPEDGPRYAHLSIDWLSGAKPIMGRRNVVDGFRTAQPILRERNAGTLPGPRHAGQFR